MSNMNARFAHNPQTSLISREHAYLRRAFNASPSAVSGVIAKPVQQPLDDTYRHTRGVERTLAWVVAHSLASKARVAVYHRDTAVDHEQLQRWFNTAPLPEGARDNPDMLHFDLRALWGTAAEMLPMPMPGPQWCQGYECIFTGQVHTDGPNNLAHWIPSAILAHIQKGNELREFILFAQGCAPFGPVRYQYTAVPEEQQGFDDTGLDYPGSLLIVRFGPRNGYVAAREIAMAIHRALGKSVRARGGAGYGVKELELMLAIVAKALEGLKTVPPDGNFRFHTPDQIIDILHDP